MIAALTSNLYFAGLQTSNFKQFVNKEDSEKNYHEFIPLQKILLGK